MAKHNDLGKWGEQKAVEVLKQKGYQVVELNYRFQRDEVDVIATKEEKYIFVEVKTRTNTQIQEPEQAVTKAKQKRIFKVAHHYLELNNIEKEAQFDIITVTQKQSGLEVNHIADAFMPQW